MDQLEQTAKKWLEGEGMQIAMQIPVGIAMTLQWRRQKYLGSVQQLYPDFDSQVVMLSKTISPVPDALVREISFQSSGRLELIADDECNLSAPHIFARRIEDRITFLTDVQSQYLIDHPANLREQPVYLQMSN